MNIKAIKRELIRAMRAGGHCAESIAMVDRASTAGDLADVMNFFFSSLADTPFPSTQWIRKIYAQDSGTLNSLGIYVDEKTDLDADGRPLWFFGNCRITLNIRSVRYQRCMVRDNGRLNIVACDGAQGKVIAGASASVEMEHQGRHVTLKVLTSARI